MEQKIKSLYLQIAMGYGSFRHTGGMCFYLNECDEINATLLLLKNCQNMYLNLLFYSLKMQILKNILDWGHIFLLNFKKV